MTCDCRLKHDFYVEGVCSICRKPRVLSEGGGPLRDSPGQVVGSASVVPAPPSENTPDPFDPYVDALMGDGTH